MSNRLFFIPLLLILHVGAFQSYAQVDSLLSLYESEQEDSSKLKLILEVGWLIHADDPDSALYYSDEAEKLAVKVQNPFLAEDVYRLKAFCYGDMNDRPHCLENHLVRVKLIEMIPEISRRHAVVYFETAAVLLSQGQVPTAELYYNKCTDAAKEIGDKDVYAYALMPLSDIKKDRGDLEGAKKDMKVSMSLSRDSRKIFAAMAASSLADILIDQDSISLADSYLDTAYLMLDGLTGNDYAAFVDSRAGIVAYKKGDYKSALQKFNRAKFVWEKDSSFFYLDELYLDLAKTQSHFNPDSANYYYEKHIELREQVNTEDNNAQMAMMEAKFKNAKKEKEIALLSKENEISELDAKRSSQISWIAMIGLLVVFGLLVFLTSRFRIIRKQKSVIEQRNEEIILQKEIVEEKSKELTDSIMYAKRIQTAIMPSIKRVNELLPENFILYKPKAIVAGDFYWMQEVEGGVLFAAADCTGHGVPGAMVSVICNNGLNRSVREYDLKQPSDILNKTREIVLEEFEKSEDEVKDGMDIALCKLSGNELLYAGAHNPLWIIRKGIDEIEEIKANKQPIGQFDDPQPYVLHKVKLNKGDTFYIFSDGFADQFGGDKGKKFKASNLKKLILSIQHLSMSDQLKNLEKTFEEWKGTLEQLDDVCVIGVRV